MIMSIGKLTRRGRLAGISHQDRNSYDCLTRILHAPLATGADPFALTGFWWPRQNRWREIRTNGN
jgi:hypothetical protein